MDCSNNRTPSSQNYDNKRLHTLRFPRRGPMNEKHTNLIHQALFSPHHLETRDQSLRPRPEVGNVLSFKLFLNKTFCIFLFNFLVYFPFCLCHAKALGSEIGGEHIFGAGGRGSGTRDTGVPWTQGAVFGLFFAVQHHFNTPISLQFIWEEG
ncbi:hypothetical protein VTI28DRAFT_4765 [Corynascus sepedonium]